jgi:hypothetical protein
MREMSSGTRCCMCEVALVSGPVRGRQREATPGGCPCELSSCLQMCSAYQSTRDAMDMRHASRANTISSCQHYFEYGGTRAFQIWRTALVRDKLNSRARAATLCCILLTPRPIKGSHFDCQPFKRSYGMGGVAVSVSLGPTGSKPLFLESSCGMFTCTVPWRQNLALAHMLALKGGPYPGR